MTYLPTNNVGSFIAIISVPWGQRKTTKSNRQAGRRKPNRPIALLKGRHWFGFGKLNKLPKPPKRNVQKAKNRHRHAPNAETSLTL